MSMCAGPEDMNLSSSVSSRPFNNYNLSTLPSANTFIRTWEMAASILSGLAAPATLSTAIQQFSQNSGYDDWVALSLLAVGGAGYLSRGRLWGKPDPYYHKWFERPQE